MMLDLFIAYRPLIDLFLLHTGYALGQYLLLRSGTFSIASAGLTAIGAYTAASLTVKLGLPVLLSILVGTACSVLISMLLAWPLTRLRGVYQAIATLAFVQVVLSLNIYAEGITGGAMGLSGIPKAVGTWTLLISVAVAIYLVASLNHSRTGRAFDAIRQDEAVAVSLGVAISRYQLLAFALSGALAGYFGALEAFHVYSLEPNQFGFTFLVAVLSYVVLGGRHSVWGPVVGTAVLVALPEVSRPLADYRMMVYGLLLILVINFMPRGIVDTWIDFRKRRQRVQAAEVREQEAA